MHFHYVPAMLFHLFELVLGLVAGSKEVNVCLVPGLPQTSMIKTFLTQIILDCSGGRQHRRHSLRQTDMVRAWGTDKPSDKEAEMEVMGWTSKGNGRMAKDEETVKKMKPTKRPMKP